MTHVYFDLDDTIVDDSGELLRPGIMELFNKLVAHNVMISLWTASEEERAMEMVRKFGLEKYFTHYVFREDYDPFAENLPKDIRYNNGDILIDDNPDYIKYVKSIGLKGILISPCSRNSTKEELSGVFEKIVGGYE